MALNSITVKKLLLTAGLLIVLGQGLWQLPQLQEYLFPVDHLELILGLANKESQRIKGDLITLNQRLDYLTWIQAHNGPDQKISLDRLRTFPFSECIRPLAPKYSWQTNTYLAHKTRVRVERKLRSLEGLLKNIDPNGSVHLSPAGPEIPAKTAAVADSMEQIQQLQSQYIHYQGRLMDLTRRLAWIEHIENNK
jgi:hypothetical protein